MDKARRQRLGAAEPRCKEVAVSCSTRWARAAIAKAVVPAVVAALCAGCAGDRGSVRDWREVASPAGTPAAGAEAAAGLLRVTSSSDTENLFFAPAADARSAVFASNRHSDNWRLYRTDLERANLLYAIAGGETGNNMFPSLRADGGAIAFASDRDGAWRIYSLALRANAVPGVMTPPDEECIAPAWDPSAPPSAPRLAYSRHNARDAQWEVWVLDVATGQRAFVSAGLFPAWSPDGNYLAIQMTRGRDEGQFSLWLVRVDQTEPARELVMAENWAAANPSWSPDGKYIAFNTVGRGPGERLTGAGGGIYVLALQEAGRLLGPLPGGERESWRPAWAANGKIYFHRREGGAVNVFAVESPVAGRTPKEALAERRL